MKRALLSIVIVLSLGLVGSGKAAVINVPGDMGLQAAVNTAAGNGEDDTINIAVDTYNTAGTTFSYTPSLGPPEENYSLTIVGGGWESTILDGRGSEQVMYIDTTGLADDSGSHLTMRWITFQNGNNANFGGGLRVDRIRQTSRWKIADSEEIREISAAVPMPFPAVPPREM